VGSGGDRASHAEDSLGRHGAGEPFRLRHQELKARSVFAPDHEPQRSIPARMDFDVRVQNREIENR
jgi:hypothetical protein